MDTRLTVLGMAVLLLAAVRATDPLFKLMPEVEVVAKALAVASPGQDQASLSSAIMEVLASHFREGQRPGVNATAPGMCCQCLSCQKWCQECGLPTCCCEGGQGCACISCSNSPDKAFQFEAETFKLLTWADRVKLTLRQKVKVMTGLPDSKLGLLDGVVDTYLTFLQ